MLKHEVLQMMTVEEWGKFKAYLNGGPKLEVIKSSDNNEYEVYPDGCVYDFLLILRSGCPVPGVQAEEGGTAHESSKETEHQAGSDLQGVQ